MLLACREAGAAVLATRSFSVIDFLELEMQLENSLE